VHQYRGYGAIAAIAEGGISRCPPSGAVRKLAGSSAQSCLNRQLLETMLLGFFL
jgi:hypothetical protein